MTRAHSVIRACAFSLAAVAWLAAAAVSQAAIIAYDSGINYWTTAPTDVTQGERNMSGKLLAFDEQQDVTLASLLNVDHYDDAHPYNVTLSENNTGNSGSVAAGTLVDSHFVYYDRSNSGNTTGSITFDSPIVGPEYTGRDAATPAP